MPTFAQDYASLPGSTEAAVHHARAIVNDHQPHRTADAEHIIRAFFTAALARTGPEGNISLITTVTSNKIRFEIHDSDTPVPGAEIDPEAHRVISGLADRYGSQATRARHMAWAELHNRRAVTT